MATTLDKKPAHRNRSLAWNAPFDRLFRNDFLDFWNADALTTVPSININETEKSYLVEMAAPGLKKEDFDIRIDNNLLTISCETESSNKSEGNNNSYFRQEYNYSSFLRTVSLPEHADTKDIQAKYTDGILKLDIPKKPESLHNASRKIEVK